ncbi:MAG: hypothetical protein ABIR37_01870 [Candidatus Saccharimonadales bacterium]
MTFETLTSQAEFTEQDARQERALNDANMYVQRADAISTASGVRKEFYTELKRIVGLYEFDNDIELESN